MTFLPILTVYAVTNVTYYLIEKKKRKLEQNPVIKYTDQILKNLPSISLESQNIF